MSINKENHRLLNRITEITNFFPLNFVYKAKKTIFVVKL